ncbi:MAG: PcfJ domain-containing protein [Actinomycetota bacterium]
MAELNVLCAGLAAFDEGRATTVLAHDEPVATFRPAPNAVVRVALVMPTGRAQDVSLQPRTVGRRLSAEAARHRLDANRWRDALAAHLVARYPDAAEPGRMLDEICALLPFPLVRQLAAVGVGTPPTVPAWAAPALRAETFDASLVALFGGRVTRGLRRAVREGLTAGDTHEPLDLAPVGLASTLPATWEIDRVATIAAGSGWHPPASWPSVEQRSELRRIWPSVPERIGVRLCHDALAAPTGVSALWAAMRLCETLIANGHPVPTTIDGMHELASAEAERTGLPVPANDAPRRGPRAGPTPRTDVPGWGYPITIELVEGYRHGATRFVLPRSADDLRRWGTSLGNCLADYVDDVRAGRTYVIGLVDGDRLVGALELGHDLLVRQLEGPRNQPADEDLQTACRHMLRDLGIARP